MKYLYTAKSLETNRFCLYTNRLGLKMMSLYFLGFYLMISNRKPIIEIGRI